MTLESDIPVIVITMTQENIALLPVTITREVLVIVMRKSSRELRYLTHNREPTTSNMQTQLLTDHFVSYNSLSFLDFLRRTADHPQGGETDIRSRVGRI